MKKGLLVAVVLLCMVVVGCGKKKEEAVGTEVVTENSTEEISVHPIGESIETDILRITLKRAQFTIKMNSVSTANYSDGEWTNVKISDDYFLADEYNAAEDAGLAYVAAKGHTFIAIEYEAENLDRTSVDFDGSFNTPLFSASYKGNDYTGNTVYGCDSKNGLKWEKYDSSNVLLLAGEIRSFRCYIDIPIDVDSLDDEFTLYLSLPTSGGKIEKFAYDIKQEDIVALEEQGMTLEEAVYDFTDEEAQDYFKTHKGEYSSMNEENLMSLLSGKKWHIVEKTSYGSQEAYYVFEDSGSIKETLLNLSDKPTGYFNELTWSASGGKLTIKSPKKDEMFEVYKVDDDVYVGFLSGNPYLLINK